MSSEKTNSIFNKLYANRIVFKREGSTIVNLSLLFCIIAFLLLLFFTLVGDAVGYFTSIYKEITFRLY